MNQLEFNRQGESNTNNYKYKEREKGARNELLLELASFITSGNIPTSDISSEECSGENKTFMKGAISPANHNNNLNNNSHNDVNIIDKDENTKVKSIISYSRRAIETKTGTIHDFVAIFVSPGEPSVRR